MLRQAACCGRTSIRPSRPQPWLWVRTYADRANVFREGDLAVLRQTNGPADRAILTKPLQSTTKIPTHKGNIAHEDIIGKSARDVVQSSSGVTFRVHAVTLSEYALMSRRLVTPIYPADANLIVSLFDIHASPPSAEDEPNSPPFEILEAGTGHGALTLHLSRAIHVANPPRPAGSTLINHQPSSASSSSDESTPSTSSPASDFLLQSWRSARRAVLHTIDQSATFSKHAAKVVRGFRRGMYADNVDFHVGDVSQWVDSQLEERGPQPFLAHAFLDLPSPESHLKVVSSAVHTDGIVMIFAPSVTQIIECFRAVKEEGLPLHLDQVLELGQNGTSGGREWDLRAVVPRSVTKAKAAGARPSDDKIDGEADDAEENSAELTGSSEAEVSPDQNNQDESWKFVCRPKVGKTIIGGGFLAVFRKKAE